MPSNSSAFAIGIGIGVSVLAYIYTKGDLFLSDIVLRPEFIFPELEMSNGPKKRKLSGRTDYTVGFGK